MFQMNLDPNELWHYNYCMGHPHVKVERRAIVDKVIVLVCIVCNCVEFILYFLIFCSHFLNLKKTARDNFFNTFA